MSDQDEKFYVNMGRWASSLIGPFESRDDAQAHIDAMDWRGSEPTVVTILPPTTTWSVGFALLGTGLAKFRVEVRASSGDDAVKAAREVVGDPLTGGYEGVWGRTFWNDTPHVV